MKYLLILLVLPLLVSFHANNSMEDVDWYTDFGFAKKQAYEDGKNILVYFTGSDWCGPCIQLKKDLFERQEFISLSKEYIMVYIDIPRKKTILSPEQLKA